MTKIRVLIFLSTIIIVGSVSFFVSLYARGYRFDIKRLRLSPNGILVAKSDPDSASVVINGDLITATNATIPLSPGLYDLTIKKEGFSPWSKRITIEKEIVTEAQAFLFRTVPSLSAITFSGVANPVPAHDFTKLAYTISGEKKGLWIIETLNLPIGFARDPKQITDGDLTDSDYEFSPDERQILLTTKFGVFLLDTGTFTPQSLRINVASRKEIILAQWQKEKENKLTGQQKNLPPELLDILTRRAKNVVFSPDETKILYTAISSGTLKENLIPPLPGSSTQKQERTISEGKTYVYDIKEDRNFLVHDQEASLGWFPTSHHLVLTEEGRVSILDYDGTNKQTVYSGSYVTGVAYPLADPGKLIILTNLGASDSVPNLYSIGLK